MNNATVTQPETYTVWVYQADINEGIHFSNDLEEDTYADLAQAVAVAKQKTEQTEYDSGYAKIVGNHLRTGGDSGVIAVFIKNEAGSAKMLTARRDYHAAITNVAAKRARSSPSPSGM